ncbi:TetR/AcrR family transcriptional regulator [Clostridium sp. P21]|uniref:TetR/AcrR family transcriptional regulator n=1 Tax=Clostridium muellerianum TaxID=2716538 RepID=A0A7Y0EGF7_9CLOT|nr:TetR/AcrR family transcriptional regulator [Clostridium muellerianum]NMM62990.1 TetR/AcrR family transcriptional regulator [Clostridium muellerianum]
MIREIRIPRQKRSIEKRNKIIDAAYEIFNEKGYNNTTTVDIAKRAGIATGSVYAYFKDKKDIFIQALLKYGNIMQELVINKFNQIPMEEDLLNVIKEVINILIESHNISKNLHNEIMSLSFLDEDIKNHFKTQHDEITNRIFKQLERRNIIINNSKEKMFLALNSADALCHELIFSSDTNFDREIAIDQCAYMIKCLLTY